MADEWVELRAALKADLATSEDPDDELADALGVRLNGSRWSKIVDGISLGFTRHWLTSLLASNDALVREKGVLFLLSDGRQMTGGMLCEKIERHERELQTLCERIDVAWQQGRGIDYALTLVMGCISRLALREEPTDA